MSAFTTVVGRLSELSESELSQLYLIVGVRLGKTQASPSSQRSTGPPPNRGGGRSRSKTGAPRGGKKPSSKGNPSRKSQWETHPLYREYKRLKKVVETQAKAAKQSFAAVDTPERAAYNTALSQWLEAKSSFRDRNGPEKEAAEATSAKGKEAARAPPAEESPSAGPAPAENTWGQHPAEFQPPPGQSGVHSWADEANESMDVSSDGGSQGEPTADDRLVLGSSAPNADGPKRTASKASLPARPSSGKKSSRGRKR